MVDAVHAHRIPWRLHYAGRSLTAMAFLDHLAPHGESVTCWPSDTGPRLDPAHVIPPPRDGLSLYVCGPARLIDAIHAATHKLGWAASDVHSERFKPTARPATTDDQPFVVHAARSDKTIEVSADETLLQALGSSGIAVDSSCLSGVCGTCMVRVLAGSPEHRDDVLTSPQREAGDSMLVCVSRAISSPLVLDV
ncbi:iron-sulfur cluster-binding domain-containing protein [Mycobacterium paraense]|uniref:flavin reductase family protein n=1 Tax=Mycobacterium paraense TaxID=767916 RepID=UPI0030C6FDE1